MLKRVVILFSIVLFYNLAFSAPPFLGIIKWTENGARAVIVPDFKTIIIINSTGEQITKLELENWLEDFVISPDSEKIVYSVRGEGLWIMNLDGTGKEQLAKDGSSNLTWSPDGLKITYTSVKSSSEKTEIGTYLMNIESKEKTQIYKKEYEIPKPPVYTGLIESTTSQELIKDTTSQ